MFNIDEPLTFLFWSLWNSIIINGLKNIDLKKMASRMC